MKKILLVVVSLLASTAFQVKAQTVEEPEFELEAYVLATDSTLGQALPLENAYIKAKAAASMFIVGIGKAKSYYYVNGTARQISSDQSYGRFLYEQGEINDIEELEPEMRSAIISSMGSMMQNPKIDFIPFVPEFGADKDDTVIICSDGLSDHFTTDEIEIAMSLELPFRDKMESLCELALEKGSTDNISIIGIKPYNTDEEYQVLVNEKVEEPEPEPEIEVAIEEKQMAEESIANLEQFISSLIK